MAKNTQNQGDVIVRFSEVTFGYSGKRNLIEEVSFAIRDRAKITLMGQNGAGKSTIFKLILGELPLEEGAIHIRKGATIGIASQVVKKDDLDKTVLDFFAGAFTEKIYDLEPRVKKILDVVNLKPNLEKKISEFSGGEQARLLLAFALIQNPDILLLDEPTNNLDKEGISHLTNFLIQYSKTVIVISHDAQFLNSFTQGVLYLDVYKKTIEQYVGNYLKVVEDISERIERERRENVRLEKEISDRKDKMNFFAQKGGHMRDVARKMREAIEELESQIVDMREEDKTINSFRITAKENTGPVIKLKAVSLIKNGKETKKAVDISLKRTETLFLTGPNGIGKTTLLKKIWKLDSALVEPNEAIEIGYYSQDFSELDGNKTVYEALVDVAKRGGDERLRSVAAQFLLPDELLRNKIESLSEGQKGLLCFARFVLQEPNLLILDEPTNHINFRHLPVIGKALNEYQGAIILVSHMADFVSEIKINHTLDLGSL
ncbi:MAG: ABC-F family ATP-binding cassette domain-containing protein [Candidatus Harrisonbacteria bacterium]|nr:ABC-F family ATP-binding cassette domain-containing protein [Candidatus Harrisonbacteria bacterium]